MQRRSTAMSGCVNFPINNPAWKSTGEGGMVVKLVVCDDREFDSQFGVCSGAYVIDMLCESFIGDDRRPYPVAPAIAGSLEALDAQQQAERDWVAHHFPNLDGPDEPNRYLSRPYLATLVLGTTGWSGSDADHNYWQCRFEDLSAAGQILYQQIEALYPGCTLHLLTFLDT